MSQRKSGIFLHLGYIDRCREVVPFEYNFIKHLIDSHQTVWQNLPINPPGRYNSPYSALSSFAGDINLLSEKISVNYNQNEYGVWLERNSDWNKDWALYRCLKNEFGNKEWYKWPDEYKFRDETSISNFERKRSSCIDKLLLEQFLFDKKWAHLKQKCNDKGISLFGDVSFYVALDSADVWSNPHLFDLDSNFAPRCVSGVPPDFFSKKGQVWHNPLYVWKEHLKTNFKWWQRRIEINKERFDLLRIDHFRAIVSNWAIPHKSKTAVEGYWRRGPGEKLLRKLLTIFPAEKLVAEDLGIITKPVKRLIDNYKIKGMRVLQFGYHSRIPNEHHHTKIDENCVCYIGTHDNNTIRGWFSEKRDEIGKFPGSYSSLVKNLDLNEANISKKMIELAMSTKAEICIITIQDLLNMGEEGRINVPGQNKGNWQLSIGSDELDRVDWNSFRKLTETTDRIHSISK